MDICLKITKSNLHNTLIVHIILIIFANSNFFDCLHILILI